MFQHRILHRLSDLRMLGPVAGAVHVAALAQGADGVGLPTCRFYDQLGTEIMNI